MQLRGRISIRRLSEVVRREATELQRGAAAHREGPTGAQHARSERILLIAGFLSALFALLFFAWIAEETLEGETALFDSAVTNAIHAHSSSALTTIMKALTMLGSSLAMTPLAILVLAVCYFRREFHALKTLAATFIGALVLEATLKPAFHRARPIPFFDLPTPASFSFPSGHALFSFCFFAGIAAVVSPRLARAGKKIVMWFVAVVMICGIGLSRIYLGVHYPSDVLAGYAAGVVWVATVKFVDGLHRRNVEREWRPPQHA